MPRHQFYLSRRIIAAPPLFISAGTLLPRHHYLGRRIPSPRHHYLGRRVQSPRHHHQSWPAHPIAYLIRRIHCRATIANLGWHIPSSILAGASHRCAAILYFDQCIPLPCCPVVSWSAYPISRRQSYLGRRIPLPRHNLLSPPARSFNAAPQFLDPTCAVPPHESISLGGGGGQSFSAGG